MIVQFIKNEYGELTLDKDEAKSRLKEYFENHLNVRDEQEARLSCVWKDSSD